MKEAKKPDLKAPRYRKPAPTLLSKEAIAVMREKVPGCNVLSDRQIKDVIYEFNEMVWTTVISERDGVELPNQLGHIFIGTCPAKKKTKNVDFKASADYLKVIQHRNWESDNYLAKIFYTSYGSKYRYRHNDLWAFNPTRKFKRMVGKTYPELWKKYIMVDPKKKISYVYKTTENEIVRNEISSETINEYNEFDL